MINEMTDLSSVAAYLRRIGAEPRSLRVAVVKEIHGTYWQDVATIRINPNGTIESPAEYAPTDSEAIIIKGEVTEAEWPTSIKLGKSYMLPSELENVDKDDIFEIKDRNGDLLMIHQRLDKAKENGKRYRPWSFWSDNKWRGIEPEGQLPLYNMDRIGDHETVFIHEGAKSARAVHRLVNPRTQEEKDALAAHPWGRELSGAAHIGWIGGALNPSRTDWSELMKAGFKRAYIVADNDRSGKAAVPKISQKLRGMIVFSIEFSEMWPPGFDLADEFPKKMFATLGGRKNYVGPHFRAVLHPATWATDLAPNPKGKASAVLRKEFADLWVWIEETDTYICREMPEINRPLGVFNSMVRAFSHVAGTGQLLNQAYKGRTTKICYRPDIASRMVTDRKTSAINLHTPTHIRASEGGPGPWLEFLEYLFPIADERAEVARWCATLVARPDVRMMYGLLLISERQGMGKTTLGERILSPLVGFENSGFPGERDIVESGFNGWVANKRLVIVNEIYTGHSFKAYNMLKGYITDKSINVNEKFMRPYVIENWAHILACSNSKKALRIEETDRRWFYPTLNEVPWHKGKWSEFFEWLSSGGLGVIMAWAHNYGDYVETGAHAPDTDAKTTLINESRGEVINSLSDLLEAAATEEITFAIEELRDAMRKKFGRLFETPLDFRREAKRLGWVEHPDRIRVDGTMTQLIMSPATHYKIRNDLIKGDINLSSLSPGQKKQLAEALRSLLKRSAERVNEKW